MHTYGWRSALASTAFILGIAVLRAASPAPPSPRQAQAAPVATREITLTFQPAQTKVHYMVDSTLHTVHGTFALKSGALRFDPQTGKADGAIVVNATTGESGNGSRDARMHKEILETWKFAEATFRPTQIDGQVSLTAASDFKIKGIITLHGADHDLVVPVHSEFSGNQWKGTAKFDIPYTKWGIKDPSNFFLHVKPIVNIELEMAGTQSAVN
jgi:polyisoprenoid-binding protein YceI